MSLAMSHYAKQQYGDGTYASLQPLLQDPTGLLVSSSVSLPPAVGGDLDILSASQYPHGLTQPYEEVNRIPRKRKATSSDELYGGLMISDDFSDGIRLSTEEQEVRPTPPRRRKQTKRASVNDTEDPIEAESKKHRGRPRLDTQDETAADRRRTQIRLAQRAYRHRKETTISALKQQVADLQNTIEEMNKTFLTLHDNLVNAGVLASHYSIGRQLQAATEQFVALSKLAAPESDDEEEKIANLDKGESQQSSRPDKNNRRASVPRARKSSSQSPAKADVASGDTTIDALSSSAGPELEELPLDVSNNMNSDKSDNKTDNNDNNSLALLDFSQPWYTDSLDSLNQSGFDKLDGLFAVPEPLLVDDVFERFSVGRHLASPGVYTYSFQETTFARRLHRMCLERAFRNLTNPDIQPDWYKHRFRFTLCFTNRKRILQRFQEMLKRRAGESLENFDIPFFHIGGAGTHYPRRDHHGNPIYPPNLLSPAVVFGPQPYIEAETPRAENSTQDLLENIGYGGQWYDSHDVEEYLKTMGIYLDGHSSFVEVDPSVLRLVKAGSIKSTTAATASGSSSPLDASIRTPSPLVAGIADPFTDSVSTHEFDDTYTRQSTLLSDMMPLVADSGAQSGGVISTGAGGAGSATVNPHNLPKLASQSSDAWAQFTSQPAPTLFQDIDQHQQQPNYPSLVTFDVDQFLERMVDASACLGRAPGFRKETIDNSLMLSLQESF
ncbi:hypothetical protein A1O3_01201 [Capronia epimyces CBS 606.96]|uniref:BZIP domain-containing protein n=1 Tax=Capronia epimyces CBS 606.96 TaxID=1182542 RepID=W9ZDQ3_9EURO|nr:uncharacterized protein A1O3_01201 [Capronia epimyces CBS 606.96]EXJ92649.1 hypothetical protein A1O3_01201 [Capronia epimyces CBS 606.96]